MAVRPTALIPSPKFQAYVRVSPSGSWDALASNATKLPSTALLELPKLAVGARLPPWETRSSEPGLQPRARTKPMPKSVRQGLKGRSIGGTERRVAEVRSQGPCYGPAGISPPRLFHTP